MEKIAVNLAEQRKTEPLKVLIADDDPPTRILLRAAISQWGYSVVEAANGEEAWTMLKTSQQPQLVILDWIMPKLDGLEVCKKINAELSYRPYIILLTQVSGTENIIKGLEGGADEFLSKPFNMAELRSRLSVGARIIQFKFELDQKYNELQAYISNLACVAALAADVGEKVDELRDLTGSLHDSNQNQHYIKQLSELKQNVDQMIDVIDNFQRKNNRSL